MFIIYLLFVFIVEIFAKFSSDLPDGFPKCSAKDPNFYQCTTKAANDARPFLNKGIPELGVVPIDPLFVPQVTLKSGSQAVNVEANLQNTTVRGLSRYIVSNLEIDFDKNEIRVTAMIDYITLEGNFSLNGQILLVKLKTAGKHRASMNNTEIRATQKFEIVTKNNETYVKPISIVGEMTNIEDPKLKFFDLNGGDTELEKLQMRVLDENVDVLFDEMKPSIVKIVLDVLSDLILKPIDLHVPISNILLN